MLEGDGDCYCQRIAIKDESWMYRYILVSTALTAEVEDNRVLNFRFSVWARLIVWYTTKLGAKFCHLLELLVVGLRRI